MPEWEALVVGIEAEGLRVAPGEGEPDQPFAAEVEIETGMVERPVGRNRRAVVGQQRDPLGCRPECAARKRPIVERPTVQRDA